MKKIYLSLLLFTSLGITTSVFADDASKAPQPTMAPVGAPQSASNFTPAQLTEIEKTVTDYLEKHPEVVMAAMQVGMARQQKEAVAKIEKAVADNKDKIFKDTAAPIAGNLKGTQSLVVFMDPYCGHCKRFHGELATLLDTNKDVKVIFKDLPIMGEKSVMVIKAMLAAKEQNKYEPLQKAVFESTKPLTKKQLLKVAGSLGVDTKKLEADMKSKAIQDQIDASLDLAKVLGISGTPTLILGETTVHPGYMKAEELNEALKKAAAPTPADNKPPSETIS